MWEAWITTNALHHLLASITFAIIGLVVIARRGALRRSVRHAPRLFWITVALCALFAAWNGACLIDILTGLHGHTTLLSRLCEWANLITLSGLILALVYNRLVVERTSRPRRILAIGAHPDDLELACGATLAKLADAGHQIQAVVLTGGERGGNAAVRPLEARRGAQFLGCNAVFVYDFADTRLREQANEILSAIEMRIREFNPDIIFTHSANDQHQDHQAVYEATLRAARNHGTILCYESPSVTSDFNPTFFVDIGDYVDVKIESVRQHRDQRLKPYVSAERLRGMALFRGGQAKTRYAEGFEAVRSLASSLGDI